jgi:hypothetical protein
VSGSKSRARSRSPSSASASVVGGRAFRSIEVLHRSVDAEVVLDLEPGGMITCATSMEEWSRFHNLLRAMYPQSGLDTATTALDTLMRLKDILSGMCTPQVCGDDCDCSLTFVTATRSGTRSVCVIVCVCVGCGGGMQYEGVDGLAIRRQLLEQRGVPFVHYTHATSPEDDLLKSASGLGYVHWREWGASPLNVMLDRWRQSILGVDGDAGTAAQVAEVNATLPQSVVMRFIHQTYVSLVAWYRRVERPCDAAAALPVRVQVEETVVVHREVSRLPRGGCATVSDSGTPSSAPARVLAPQ